MKEGPSPLSSDRGTLHSGPALSFPTSAPAHRALLMACPVSVLLGVAPAMLRDAEAPQVHGYICSFILKACLGWGVHCCTSTKYLRCRAGRFQCSWESVKHLDFGLQSSQHWIHSP